MLAATSSAPKIELAQCPPLPPAASKAARIGEFRESVIREMTRLALKHGAVNLAQGFPDFPAPAELKAAAQKAIADDFNQYPITWGIKPFRDAICQSYKRFYNLDIDPEREVTVCCGATEGMIASLLALLNQGDEVVVFEPFYENYWPDSQLSGATIRYVPLHPPNWDFNKDELRGAFNSKHPRRHYQFTEQPNGQSLLARPTQSSGRSLRRIRLPRHLRRDLRAHHLRRRKAHRPHQSRLLARPHRRHQQP